MKYPTVPHFTRFSSFLRWYSLRQIEGQRTHTCWERHHIQQKYINKLDFPATTRNYSAQRSQNYSSQPQGSTTSAEKGQAPSNPNDNLDVGHSRFLAEASPGKKWKGSGSQSLNGHSHHDTPWDEFEGISEGKGKLSPTSSHLFKLILPLGSLSHPSNQHTSPPSSSTTPIPPPTVILLHPSQPLSHVSRLILASLAPATPAVSFRSTSTGGQAFQWSDSTDVGDFIRDAARAAKFSICLTYGNIGPGHPSREQGASRYIVVDDGQGTVEGKEKVDDNESSNDNEGKGNNNNKPKSNGIKETIIDVEVPTFADRTRFLRRRLGIIESKMQKMEVLKKECDREAHRGAKRMALGGFGMLVVYWGAVARLTFWDYGWDVMEPITYLSGLSTVILGYLWFLYQGHEVSYTSVLDRSISARREALYKARGLDIEQWMDLVAERRTLRKEIGRIAEDYDHEAGSAGYEEEGEVEEESVEGTQEVGTRVLEREMEEEAKGEREKKKADLEDEEKAESKM